MHMVTWPAIYGLLVYNILQQERDIQFYNTPVLYRHALFTADSHLERRRQFSDSGECSEGHSIQ